MNIIPIRDKVAVVQLKNSTTTDSGIILQGDVSQEAKRGKVIAVGPEVQDVKEGDVVLLDWVHAIQSKIENIPFFLIKEQHVIAVVE